MKISLQVSTSSDVSMIINSDYYSSITLHNSKRRTTQMKISCCFICLPLASNTHRFSADEKIFSKFNDNENIAQDTTMQNCSPVSIFIAVAVIKNIDQLQST